MGSGASVAVESYRHMDPDQPKMMYVIHIAPRQRPDGSTHPGAEPEWTRRTHFHTSRDDASRSCSSVCSSLASMIESDHYSDLLMDTDFETISNEV